jgi:hypothetical protein
MDKSSEQNVDPNMQTALDVLTDIVQETLAGVAGEPMIHMIIAIPKDPGKNNKLEKLIMAGNMPPKLASEVLGVASEIIADRPAKSSHGTLEVDADDIPTYGKCEHCGEEHDTEGMEVKLARVKTLLPTLLELREIEGGREFLDNFMLKSGSPDDRINLVQEVSDAPEDTLGNLKRKFLAKYMMLSTGMSEADITDMIRH